MASVATMHRTRAAALLVGLALIGSACGGAAGQQSGASTPADAAGTAVAGTTIDGEELALADYAGDDVLLWFWAPW